MGTKIGPNGSADRHVKEIKRKTRRKFSAEEKIHIVLDGLGGEISILKLCRREGIAEPICQHASDVVCAKKSAIPVFHVVTEPQGRLV